PGAQTVLMFLEHVQKELCVRGVIFGSAGRPSFAIFCERLGVNREENKEVILQERIDESALGLFESDGNWFVSKSFPELSSPSVDLLCRVFECEAFPFSCCRVKETTCMSGISPVDANKGAVLLFHVPDFLFGFS